MRRWTFLLWLTIILGVSLTFSSCSPRFLRRSAWQPPRVVSVAGDESWEICCWHCGLRFFPIREGQPVHLLLREDDLLVGEKLAPILYRSADGPTLNLSGDEARTMLDGKTVSLSLENRDAWEWLEKSTSKELYGLRVVAIGPEVGERQLKLLKRMSEQNPNLALVIDAATCRQVLKFFDPAWLWVQNLVGEEERAILASKRRLRTLLFLEGSKQEDLTFLSQMPSLETLALDSWDPGETGPLPKGLLNLRRLTLIEPAIKELTSLGLLPKLEELVIVGLVSPSLQDVSWLTNFPQLERLSLFGCSKLNDLSPLKRLKRLKWLSLPPNTTQEQLMEIVDDHPDLLALELSGCEKVLDLSPIKELGELKYLLVFTPKAKPDPLFDMKQLKWLGIYIEKKEKKEEGVQQEEDLIMKLQEALPNTAVVRAGLCLGSGWILLLIPFIGVAWYFMENFGKKRSKPDNYGG